MLNDLGSQMKTVCLYMCGSRKFCEGVLACLLFFEHQRISLRDV